ncbi:hypothetical protein [Brachybacterium sp. YJGR34]|uniref:hypothetical protein n=1 Tax=Brachybacterium sp. YJGR34 TaxID=2059911 RepID=UPI000E0CB882|nr:hypothetical protein [Brachybacterium sp. YJGR34]
MALITTRKAKRAAEQAAAEAAAQAETSISRKAEKAVEELQKVAATVGPVISESAREVRSRAADLYDQYVPEAQQRLREQSDRLSSTVGPRAEKLRTDVQEDYLPRARKTASTTGTVVRSAADAAYEELDKGQVLIRAAILEPTARPKKKGRAGRVLLLLSLAAAGAAAGYVVWQKTRPVEDPWAPPADFARAHYPASAATEDDSSAVSDTVGAADAGDVASALKGEEDTTAAEGTSATPEATGSDDEKRGSHRGDA